ncbi:uncharacterized protein N7473_003200 [Penicillium subrubescens]|uniref:uncharacterized protein n=1 Tax=Penicillium subrubescens TaxID=1316194 RepID=UPI0025451A14|nr:uncharacterized protein N7473_003200 [Penicillium subrubescens]KAJ5906284.1 hypothetical protein N7473_003200 [Penicillium subrubescens]
MSILLPLLWLCHLANAALTISIPPLHPPPKPPYPPRNHPRNPHHPPRRRRRHILTTSLTRGSTLVFNDIPAGHPESYLLDIRGGEYVFAPYRVDVAADGSVMGVWETFRGNPWENRGAEKYVVDVAGAGAGKKAADVVVEAKVLGKKGFYEERAKFSPLSLVKNPMILMAIVALVLTLGMPKLMENMDPEMRAEFEQQSRASPITGATTNAMTGGGFDLAGWMAGTAPNPMTSAEGATGRETTTGSARKRG